MPVVACLMDVGAGGAYYIATAADAVVAHPTCVTGGIGVILRYFTNLQERDSSSTSPAVPIRSATRSTSARR